MFILSVSAKEFFEGDTIRAQLTRRKNWEGRNKRLKNINHSKANKNSHVAWLKDGDQDWWIFSP